MGTQESSMNITLTIYKTVVDRAQYGYTTRSVRLPAALYESMQPEDIAWLQRGDLLGLTIERDDGLTEPVFVDT